MAEAELAIFRIEYLQKADMKQDFEIWTQTSNVGEECLDVNIPLKNQFAKHKNVELTRKRISRRWNSVGSRCQVRYQ